MNSAKKYLILARKLIRDIEIPQLFIEKRITTTPSQFFVLLTILQKKRCTMSDLANEMRVSLPSVTNATSRLVNLGYIERLPDESDRRKVIVTATKTGRELIAQTDSLIEKHMERLLSRLSTEEEEMFVKLLSKLTNAEEKD